MIVLTADQMRQADRIAIEEMGIPGRTLMEKAGQAVADETGRVLRQDRIGRRRGMRGRIAILCGRGNNGGDGLVAARILSAQHHVWVMLTSTDFSPDAERERRRLSPRVRIIRVDRPAGRRDAGRILAGCDVVLDALFGTGLSRPIPPFFRRIIEEINRMSKPVVAVDIPSGIDASTGQILGAAVRAAVTVTFARPKVGHLLHPGAGCTGRLVVADIGIPDEAIVRTRPDLFLMTHPEAARLVPPRPDHSHKGLFGRSVILAGSRGMIGAAVLSAEAAMRSGSGLTTLCVPAGVYSIAARKIPPEAMCHPVSDSGLGAFAAAPRGEPASQIRRSDAILVGPGIGRDSKTVRWVRDLIDLVGPGQRLILDADALYAMAEILRTQRHFRLRGDVVLTPHAGEMARLTGRTRQWVEHHPLVAAREYAGRMRCAVVLKGSRTIIADADGRAYINRTGNASLAKGGSGDVLAGMICGLAAQGLSAVDAARLAVYLHGRSADIGVERGRDKRTILASELFTWFDAAFRELNPVG